MSTSEISLVGYSLCTRNLIMYPDLSVCGRLFGGKLLSFIDEALAMQAMSIMGTQHIVTKKMGEVNFLSPGLLGDILEIWAKEESRGKTSLTVTGKVIVHRESNAVSEKILICNCSIVYVAIDAVGLPFVWNKNL